MVALAVLAGSAAIVVALERLGSVVAQGLRDYTEFVGGSFALPPGPDEEYEPFDEKVAVMHLAGELDDLDYEDLVFD